MSWPHLDKEPPTPQNSTDSQEAETGKTKLFVCFGSIFVLARGKNFAHFLQIYRNFQMTQESAQL